MNVGVVESNGGIRCVLSAFLLEEGYKVKDYKEVPVDYEEATNMVIFGPTITVQQEHLNMLNEKRIPYLQLEYFADMEVVMEQVAKFAHTEQSILEDRAV